MAPTLPAGPPGRTPRTAPHPRILSPQDLRCSGTADRPSAKAIPLHGGPAAGLRASVTLLPSGRQPCPEGLRPGPEATKEASEKEGSVQDQATLEALRP